MSVTLGPRLGLMLNAAAGDAHPNEFRAFLRGMDALCQISAKSRTTAAQPSSPTNGDTYLLPASATGTAWGGKAAGTIAYYTTQQTTTSNGTENTVSGWDFFTPKRGYIANVEDESNSFYKWTGSTWALSNAAYDEGTWTPTATNLGGTSITYLAKWIRVGNAVDFQLTIYGSGLTSTAASTRVTLPFTPARPSVGCAENGNVSGDIAQISTSGTVWIPTFASTGEIRITGKIFLN